MNLPKLIIFKPFNRKTRFSPVSYLISIQYCHKCIENLHFNREKLLCNFVVFCNFFACAHSILKNFGLETEHLFYVA